MLKIKKTNLAEAEKGEKMRAVSGTKQLMKRVLAERAPHLFSYSLESEQNLKHPAERNSLNINYEKRRGRVSPGSAEKKLFFLQIND